MVFLLNNDYPETYRIRVLLRFRQFVRTVQCVASWNAQQHIIVLLLQTSIVSLLFIKWPFIGRKVLFLDAFLYSSRLDSPGLNKGRPFFLSLCSWKENGEPSAGISVVSIEMLKAFLHSALEQNQGLLKRCMGVNEKATHRAQGEARARVLQHSTERVSFGARECPESSAGDSRTAVGTGHRVSDISDCLLLTVVWRCDSCQRNPM